LIILNLLRRLGPVHDEADNNHAVSSPVHTIVNGSIFKFMGSRDGSVVSGISQIIAAPPSTDIDDISSMGCVALLFSFVLCIGTQFRGPHKTVNLKRIV